MNTNEESAANHKFILTLAGFCFTLISFLLGIWKDIEYLIAYKYYIIILFLVGLLAKVLLPKIRKISKHINPIINSFFIVFTMLFFLLVGSLFSGQDFYGVTINEMKSIKSSDGFYDVTLSGTYKNQPPDGYTWLVVKSGGRNQYWPKGPITLDTAKQSWSAAARSYLEGDEHENWLIVTMQRDGKALFDYYLKVSPCKGEWRPLEMLTSDVMILARKKFTAH